MAKEDIKKLGGELYDLNAQAVGPITSEGDVKKSLGELYYGDFGARRAAAGALLRAVEEHNEIVLNALTKLAYDNDMGIRRSATKTLAAAADVGMDISAAVPALAGRLCDEDPVVKSNAAVALGLAASKKIDISTAIPALANTLFDEDSNVAATAARALKIAAKNGMDISAAAPGLTGALVRAGYLTDLSECIKGALDIAITNEKSRERTLDAVMNSISNGNAMDLASATDILEKVAKRTEINLEEVKKALARFVDNEVKRGTTPRKIAERKASKAYVKIANAESKRRTSIGMDGLMLPAKIKQPKGPKMYRAKRTIR